VEEETDRHLTRSRSTAKVGNSPKSPEKLTVRDYYRWKREAAEAALHQSADKAAERAPVAQQPGTVTAAKRNQSPRSTTGN
jgi:hypothetical protein